ncbi:MAG: 16S rRNA (cytidine(1402)-2'-O)-methyltransferase [Deltaproteobacteria bacterium RIFOXYA12_FULL_58_15]|nr:MAG: 16S rRNA (cytidine(1402)-2'-O)-methyltransferase [Deltaproteobacteria bacterium RIFOXYA12_FULL_58_15]
MASNKGTLYIVATPIGNLDDLSSRAAKTLRQVDVVYAEDTRHSKTLLSHIDSNRRLVSLHEHNEAERAEDVIALLLEGKSAALVSDAGTPAVSDPGSRLVAAVVAAGIRVCPIPGASALATALSVSGFAASSTDVLFVGFLPAKGKDRRAVLAHIATHTGAAVLYEAPHRVRATLADLGTLNDARAACLCRELTKLHEEIRHATVAELLDWSKEVELRGEFTLVLGPLPEVESAADAADDAVIDAALTRCLDAGLTARDASSAVAAVLELPRRRVYSRCQSLR